MLNRFNGKVVIRKSDINGQWLMIIIELNDHNYILVNIYHFNNWARNKRLFCNLGTMIDVEIHLLNRQIYCCM